MRRDHLVRVMVALILAAATACGGDEPIVVPLDLPSGYQATIYATDLHGPTQMVFAPDGDLIVAELNGQENDGTGRILRLNADDPAQRAVLQDGLDKPTGIALVDGTLWIMEHRQLSRATTEAGAPRDAILRDLPSNGRSQGTLTITPSGDLLFDTSGSKRGPNRVNGSGILFRIGESGEPEELATGFKHAYTHLVDGDGQIWTVEMTDGNFDEERASDELVAITQGDDAGWPQCVEDNRPVIEYGGTPELCATAPASHALFGDGATPTSIVVSPWDPDVFLVALWLRGEVVAVPRNPRGEQPHQPTVFIGGIESPQHLLVDGDRLLVSDHETGRLFAIDRTSGN